MANKRGFKCFKCDQVATWRVNKYGYYGNVSLACDAHVFDAVDGKLTESWKDYTCEVRRIPNPQAASDTTPPEDRL